ncbi:MAG: sulfatase-like hydrolase/transferase [Gemmataceae bacterium]|nr:sulfatase-like hydrolase/transferase [Gemmataceae bacterium]
MRAQRSFSICVVIGFALLAAPSLAQAQESKPKRKLPNIVWITSEDHGPHLGCYGDKLARTPNLDKLAAKGMRYRMCWSNAPVCAPARTTIISGLYPTSTGAEHMRSMTSLPKHMQMFPALLRALGYYCSNRVKEDYNLRKDGKVWDDSSNKAHWRNRPNGIPFFAVFNSTKSHESQLRGYKKVITDPAKVRVPAYHPDTEEVRRDWARYYDIVALVDADAAAVIRELEEAGLLEDTIIFYFADHGSGMPRSKRMPLNSGLQVPFIVWFPDNWKHLAPPEYRPGAVSNRLISFVDLAPTMLSLADSAAPKWMQGRAFAGKHIQPAPEFLHGFRGRMDERYDLQRSVTDGRYVYLRNYMPHLPAGQHLEYQMQTRTTAVWKKLFDEGKLNEAQSQFWKAPRAPEELYDLQNDPDEVRNLAASAHSRDLLTKLRNAHRTHALTIRDVGFLPEGEIHSRCADYTPYHLANDPGIAGDPKVEAYRLTKTLDMAMLASSLDNNALPNIYEGLRDKDSAVRYWATIGLVSRGKEIITGKLAPLRHVSMLDPSPYPRVLAAEALVRYGEKEDYERSLNTLIEFAQPKHKSVYVRLAALNALDRLGDKVRPALATIKGWPTDAPKGDRASYGIRLINKIVKQLEN